MQPKVRYAIVCDFDGTITCSDVWDSIWDHFTGTDWREFNKGYADGTYTYPDVVKHCSEVANFSRSQALEFVDQNMKFRQGFSDFVNLCDTSAVPLIIASGGLDFYVFQMLKPFLNQVSIFCNPTEFKDDGSLEIFLPEFNEEYCPSCGNCKRKYVEKLKQQGYKVIGIGDGTTDRCLAKAADIVFARDSLLEWCRETELKCIEFSTFDEISNMLFTDNSLNIKSIESFYKV
jgi:2-hydroxy-3-keto-5-methylthiopentenyl-1-phosphate phosphatase